MFGHQKQLSPPFGSSLTWALKWLLMCCFTLLTPPHIKVTVCLYNLLGNLGPQWPEPPKDGILTFCFLFAFILFEWILSPRFGVSLDWYAILCPYLILLCTNLKSKECCYWSTRTDCTELFIYLWKCILAYDRIFFHIFSMHYNIFNSNEGKNHWSGVKLDFCWSSHSSLDPIKMNANF